MKILAKNLCGEHIGQNLTYMSLVYDLKYACWKDALRTSPILTITHKKNLGVNVRVGPSEFHNHQGEAQFAPDAEVTLS